MRCKTVFVLFVAVSAMTFLQSSALSQHFDAPYYALKNRKAAEWKKQDDQIDAKLAALKAKHGKSPNIIYILLDDAGYGDLSCYGQKKFETPNIDRLAKEGMKFTQHYAGSTVCAPTRSVLMTGLHTGHTASRGNKEIRPVGQGTKHRAQGSRSG